MPETPIEPTQIEQLELSDPGLLRQLETKNDLSSGEVLLLTYLKFRQNSNAIVPLDRIFRVVNRDDDREGGYNYNEACLLETGKTTWIVASGKPTRGYLMDSFERDLVAIDASDRNQFVARRRKEVTIEELIKEQLKFRGREYCVLHAKDNGGFSTVRENLTGKNRFEDVMNAWLPNALQESTTGNAILDRDHIRMTTLEPVVIKAAKYKPAISQKLFEFLSLELEQRSQQ